MTTSVWPEDFEDGREEDARMRADEDWPNGEVIGRDSERYGTPELTFTHPVRETPDVAPYAVDTALRRIHLRGQPEILITRTPEGMALQAAVDRVVRYMANHFSEATIAGVVSAILDQG